MSHELSHLVVVANRLPVVIERRDGAWRVRPASGGLVTALSPVLRDSGGTWVGWGGTLDTDNVDPNALLSDPNAALGFRMKAVVLTAEERDRFYEGFANEVIWPLFHTLDERCNFDPVYWETYQQVNAKCAEVVADTAAPDSFIWVHDYHFMPLGQKLRERKVRQGLGFFLHIPFPPLEIFLKLPWRLELLRSFLAYDIIGFQTIRDRRNFMQCVHHLIPGVSSASRGREVQLSVDGRRIHVGAFPISIDFADFAEHAGSAKVEDRYLRLKSELNGRKMMLGLDRLDYTKGIPLRLRAFGRLLREHPEFHRQVRLVQIVIPSRESIPQYKQLKAEVEELVGEINGEFTDPGWVPVHYSFRSLSRDELLAFYRVADVGLVTPLNDGMNLVAKEYCASQIDDRGVLVLSEFAGAAAELKTGAILVNPYDIVGMAKSMAEALTMPEEEIVERMAALRATVRRNDVHRWVQLFLDAAQSVQSERLRFNQSESGHGNGSQRRRRADRTRANHGEQASTRSRTT